MEDLLSLVEVGQRLDISKTAAYRLCVRGRLPYVWVGPMMFVRSKEVTRLAQDSAYLAATRRTSSRGQMSLLELEGRKDGK